MLNVDSIKKGRIKKTLMSLFMVLMMGLVFSSCFSKKEEELKTTEKTVTEAVENKDAVAVVDKTSNNIKDPVETYVKSMFKVESSYDVSGTYKLTNMKDDFIKQLSKSKTINEEDKEAFELVKLIFENSTIDFRAVVDFNKKTLFAGDFNFIWNYKGNKLASFDYFFDNWVVSILSNEIYPKGVYVDIKTLLSTFGGFDIEKIDFKKYLEIFSKEEKEYKDIDFDKYEKSLYDSYKGKVESDGMEDITILSNEKEKTINVSKLKLNIKTDDMTQSFVKILEIAKKDENLKKYILKKSEELYQIFVNDDTFKDIPKDDTVHESAMKDFEKDWESSIDDAIISLKESLKDTGKGETKSEMFYGDEAKLLKAKTSYEDSSMDIYMEMTSNEYNQNHNFNRLSIQSKGVNLFNMMMMPNLGEQIQNEIRENVKENIYKGKAYQEIIKDIKASSKISEATKVNVINMLEEAFEF